MINCQSYSSVHEHHTLINLLLFTNFFSDKWMNSVLKFNQNYLPRVVMDMLLTMSACLKHI